MHHYSMPDVSIRPCSESMECDVLGEGFWGCFVYIFAIKKQWGMHIHRDYLAKLFRQNSFVSCTGCWNHVALSKKLQSQCCHSLTHPRTEPEQRVAATFGHEQGRWSPWDGSHTSLWGKRDHRSILQSTCNSATNTTRIEMCTADARGLQWNRSEKYSPIHGTIVDLATNIAFVTRNTIARSLRSIPACKPLSNFDAIFVWTKLCQKHLLVNRWRLSTRCLTVVRWENITSWCAARHPVCSAGLGASIRPSGITLA